MVISYERGHWSIDRPITSDRNECRETDKTGKQTNNKKNQCEINLPKVMPQANSHSTWTLASSGGKLPVSGEDLLHTTNARLEPSR